MPPDLVAAVHGPTVRPAEATALADPDSDTNKPVALAEDTQLADAGPRSNPGVPKVMVSVNSRNDAWLVTTAFGVSC